ncbi:sensor domain-containing diguanylate cyclase [Metabacillus herbersteinensis]
MFGEDHVLETLTFSKVVQDILDMANDLIGKHTLFISYMNHKNFQVLKILNRPDEQFKEGLFLPIEESYCHILYKNKQHLLLSDSMLDERTKNLTITEAANIRSYAGVPIVLKNGVVFGSLCSTNEQVAQFNGHTISVLEKLASFLSYCIDLELSSVKDALTGLYNRVFWKHLLTRLSGEKMIQTFLMLDVDSFKAINDQFGHEQGDAVIVEIGKVIKESIPEYAYGFRFGGDEFGVLFYGKSVDESMIFAEKIRLKSKQITNMNKVDSSVSIGMVDTTITTIKELMKHADRLMYESKKKGGNCISL